MKKLLLIISFMLFIPFIVKADDSFNAIVINPEGANIYTEEFGSPEVVSVLEYESVIFVTSIDNNKARLDGYNDYSFVYLSDIKRVDDLKQLGLEDEVVDEPTKEVEKPIEEEKTTSSSHVTDYVILVISIVLIVALVMFKKKKETM